MTVDRRLGIITQDGHACTLDFIGLEDDSPILTIVQTCSNCGAEIARQVFDVTNGMPDGVEGVGGEQAERLAAHWREAHS